MDSSRLNKWLSSTHPDYKEGVALYDAFGSSISLKRAFARSSAVSNLRMLKYELRKIAKSVKSAKPTIKLIRVNHSEIQPLTVVEIKQPILEVNSEQRVDRVQLEGKLHKEIRSLDVSRNKLSNHYHYLFEVNAPQKELAENYANIEQFRIEILAKRKDIAYVEKFGKLPEEQQPDTVLLPQIYYKHYHDRAKLNDKKDKLNRQLKNILKLPEGSAKRTLKELEVAKIQSEQDYLNIEMKKIKANG